MGSLSPRLRSGFSLRAQLPTKAPLLLHETDATQILEFAADGIDLFAEQACQLADEVLLKPIELAARISTS